MEKTQQITSAMRMVAAAKLRRAEAAIKAARPYAERMKRTLGEVAANLFKMPNAKKKKKTQKFMNNQIAKCQFLGRQSH